MDNGPFKTALAVTLWLVGLLVALAFGMLSAYLIVSGVFVGSKVVKALRARGVDEIRRAIDPGDSA